MYVHDCDFVNKHCHIRTFFLSTYIAVPMPNREQEQRSTHSKVSKKTSVPAMEGSKVFYFLGMSRNSFKFQVNGPNVQPVGRAVLGHS